MRSSYNASMNVKSIVKRISTSSSGVAIVKPRACKGGLNAVLAHAHKKVLCQSAARGKERGTGHAHTACGCFVASTCT